jgi:hypothetical protein
MKAFLIASVVAFGFSACTPPAEACVRCVQQTPVAPAQMQVVCVARTRARPILGGWVTRCRRALVPVVTAPECEKCEASDKSE